MFGAENEEHLARVLADSQRPGLARTAGEAAVKADATAEPAYRLLARAYVAAGDTTRARGVLEQCRIGLADLGVELDPSTRALAASLST